MAENPVSDPLSHPVTVDDGTDSASEDATSQHGETSVSATQNITESTDEGQTRGNKEREYDFSVSDFAKLVNTKSFVDKTLMIRTIFRGSSRILLTAPPRFGKSTNIDMVKRFLEIEVDTAGKPKPVDTTDITVLLLGFFTLTTQNPNSLRFHSYMHNRKENFTTSGRMLDFHNTDAAESQRWLQVHPESRIFQFIRVPRLLFSTFKSFVQFFTGYYSIIEPEFHIALCLGRYMGVLPTFGFDDDDSAGIARHLPSCGFSQNYKMDKFLHKLSFLLSEEEVIAVNEIISGVKLLIDSLLDLVPGVPKMKFTVSVLDDIFCAIYAKLRRNKLLKCSAHYMSKRFWIWIDG